MKKDPMMHWEAFRLKHSRKELKTILSNCRPDGEAYNSTFKVEKIDHDLVALTVEIKTIHNKESPHSIKHFTRVFLTSGNEYILAQNSSENTISEKITASFSFQE